MRHVRTVTTASLMAGSFAVLHHLGRTAGTIADERAARLPGDQLVTHPMMITNHAITIDAPPADVWPWLAQMGWHRGGWYTSAWVDRLFFPANWPSADHLEPQLQQIGLGSWIPDGPPASRCGFFVRALQPSHHLVLHSTKHLPPEFADRFTAWIDWSWAFVLHDVPGGHTRFQFRSRLRVGPWWLATLYWAVLIPADFVMSRQMLRGVKRRAEAA
ncbi:MAG: hypothetical protein Q7V88_07365 [Actinomycetota bacterium]|nr:hypothetical protein [Actinomycetota bacterium]